MSWREDRKSYLDAHFRLQRWWATGLMNAVRQYYEVRFEVDGQETLSEGPYLLWMRHCSLLDTLLPAMLTARFSIRLRYVLKQGLLIDPCLDIVGQRLPNCFVQRDGQDTEGDIGRVTALREELGSDDAIMLYPEGTRSRNGNGGGKPRTRSNGSTGGPNRKARRAHLQSGTA